MSYSFVSSFLHGCFLYNFNDKFNKLPQNAAALMLPEPAHAVLTQALKKR
jgi:G:T-mismatch repair DNA endonuclease (very short patch repair protein)